MGHVDIGVAQERADVRMWDIKDNSSSSPSARAIPLLV